MAASKRAWIDVFGLALTGDVEGLTISVDGLYGFGGEFATGQGDVADGGAAAVGDGEAEVNFDDDVAVVVAVAAAVDLAPVPEHY